MLPDGFWRSALEGATVLALRAAPISAHRARLPDGRGLTLTIQHSTMPVVRHGAGVAFVPVNTSTTPFSPSTADHKRRDLEVRRLAPMVDDGSRAASSLASRPSLQARSCNAARLARIPYKYKLSYFVHILFIELLSQCRIPRRGGTGIANKICCVEAAPKQPRE